MQYKVRHLYTDEVFRFEAASKTQVKKSLTRYSENSGYSSFWEVTEVDLNEWNKMKRQGVKFVPQKYMAI